MKMLGSAITGSYDHDSVSRIAEADCVIGHSFGTSLDPGSPNSIIAHMATVYAGTQLPLIVDRMLVDVLPGPRSADLVAEGPISDMKGGGIGTWGALLQAREYMHEHGLNKPITVAQAFHVGRVAAQSAKLGMEPVVPRDLPRNFDPYSEQPWTRSVVHWVPAEVLNIVLLSPRKGQL